MFSSLVGWAQWALSCLKLLPRNFIRYQHHPLDPACRRIGSMRPLGGVLMLFQQPERIWSIALLGLQAIASTWGSEDERCAMWSLISVQLYPYPLAWYDKHWEKCLHRSERQFDCAIDGQLLRTRLECIQLVELCDMLAAGSWYRRECVITRAVSIKSNRQAQIDKLTFKLCQVQDADHQIWDKRKGEQKFKVE